MSKTVKKLQQRFRVPLILNPEGGEDLCSREEERGGTIDVFQKLSFRRRDP